MDAGTFFSLVLIATGLTGALAFVIHAGLQDIASAIRETKREEGSRGK